MRIALCVFLLAAFARAEELTVVEIGAAYPGHSATEIEAQLATPIERALSQMASIEDLWSESRAGVATIWASFPRADALRAAQAAIRSAAPTLPADLPAPPTLAETPSDAPGVVFVVAPPSPAAVTIGDTVATVPGTARVSLCGVSKTEAQARVDPARLAAVGLTVAEVLAALRGGSADPKLVLATRNGAPIRLDDVATVENAARTDCTARRDGAAVSLGEVRFRRGAPAGARDAVLAAIRKVEITLPPGGTLTILPEGTAVRWSPLEATLDVPEREFTLEIVAPDRDTLRAAAETLDRAATAGPELAEVGPGEAVEPTLELALDGDRAARLGVRAEDVTATFAAARGGVSAGGVRVVAIADPGDISALTVPSAGKTSVPLGAVAQLRRTAVPAVLRHSGLFPSVTLRLRPRKAFSLLDAVRLALRLEGAVPAGVRIRFRA